MSYKYGLFKELKEIYDAAEPGPMNIGELMVATGATLEQLNHTWDRLVDHGMVGCQKFVKVGSATQETAEASEEPVDQVKKIVRKLVKSGE